MKVHSRQKNFLAATLMLIMLSSAGCYYYDHDYSNPRGDRYHATPTSPAQNWEHHFGE
jgi:hypothetical protein